MNPTVLIPLLVLLVTHSPVSSQAPSPSFDCSKASGDVEKLICANEELAALDRNVASAFEKAIASWPSDEAAGQRAMQRGWIRGRDECWKADDMNSCVAFEYRRRIVEIQIQSGQLTAPTPVGYACEGGEDGPFFATFYRETDPPSAVFTYGDDQTIGFLAPSGSGSRYAAPNMEFWEHQGEASVDWYGIELACKPR